MQRNAVEPGFVDYPESAPQLAHIPVDPPSDLNSHTLVPSYWGFDMDDEGMHTEEDVNTWAQLSSSEDTEKIYVYLTILTILAADILESDLKLDLKEQSLSFKATSTSKKCTYAVDLEFFADIDPNFRTPPFSFANMTPNPWRHEEEVTPTFRTPISDTPLNSVFCDFVSGHERIVIPIFRSRPLFYGLHAVRLGIG